MTTGRFAISMHMLTLLAREEEEWVSSEFLAGSIKINPVLVRKELSNLRKHKLIVSREGKYGGARLARPAKLIRLSEVFLAVQESTILGKSKNTPNPHCLVGRQINRHLNHLASEAERALLDKLGKHTLLDFVKQFK
jgi:Rrf2 family protein